MRISDCIRINNGQNLKIIVTMLSCYNGKVVSLKKWARHALQRIRQFPDDWQLLRLWHQWLCEVAACVFYVIHERTLISPILSHSSCR